MIALDTNVLVRLANRSDPELPKVTAALERLHERGDQLVIVNQVLVEFWSVATRPVEVNGLGAEPAAARAEIERFLDLFRIVQEPQLEVNKWLLIAESGKVTGARIHDVRLAVTLLEAGVEALLTLNPNDFRDCEGLRILTPAEVPS